MDVATVDDLMQTKGTWVGKETNLKTTAGATETGETMFGTFVNSCVVHTASDVIEKEMQNGLQDDLTKAKFDAAVDKATSAAEALPGAEALPKQRIAPMTVFKTRLVPVEVQSLRHEAQVRGMNIVKARALTKKTADGAPVLKPMWCEQDLAGDLDAYGGNIEEQLLTAANLCRETASGFLDETSMKSGILVEGVIETKSATLQRLDPTVCAELAWFVWMTGDGAKEELARRVRDILPKVGQKVNEKDASLRLETLKGSVLYKYAKGEAQGLVDIIAGQVSALADERLPTVKESATGYTKEFQDLLVNFLFKDVSAGSTGAATRLCGKAVLDEDWDKIEAKALQPGGSLTYDELKKFHTWNFLLNEEQKTKHNGWVAQVFNGKQPPKKAGAASSSAAKAAPKPASSKPTSAKSAAEKKEAAEFVAGEKFFK